MYREEGGGRERAHTAGACQLVITGSDRLSKLLCMKGVHLHVLVWKEGFRTESLQTITLTSKVLEIRLNNWLFI